jgi:hypothetical protein
MSEDVIARGEDEGLEEYIARLQVIDRSGLSEDEQMALVLSLRVAEKSLQRSRLGAAPPSLSPLERCKESIRKLPQRDRERLGRWMASGMPD